MGMPGWGRGTLEQLRRARGRLAPPVHGAVLTMTVLRAELLMFWPLGSREESVAFPGPPEWIRTGLPKL